MAEAGAGGGMLRWLAVLASGALAVTAYLLLIR